MSIKLCIDCKHHKFNWSFLHHQCVHTKVAPISVVTGKPKVVICSVARCISVPKDCSATPQMCYEDGVYWEAK